MAQKVRILFFVCIIAVMHIVVQNSCTGAYS